MRLKTLLLVAIVAIFLVTILAQTKPPHFKYQVKNQQITNMDIYECSRMALNKYHGDLLGVKTISFRDTKYLRSIIKTKDSQTWEVDCDLLTHQVLHSQQTSQ